MEKLNKTFKINPLYETDGYKVGHAGMLAPNTVREYWTGIPRSTKYLPQGIDKVMSIGQQLTMRFIHSSFQENFFNVSQKEALKFVEDTSKYLGTVQDPKNVKKLYDLGYLPIHIQSLEEGIFTNPNIPHITGINTVDGFAWLGLFLETMTSKLSWQIIVAATIGYKFKTNALEWVEKTDKENLVFANFMCHDFHSRGGNPYTSIAVGLGSAASNLGSDTLNVIPAARYYYDESEDEVCIYSVNASEHSVTCTGIFYYKDLLESGKLDYKIKEYYSFDLPCDGSEEDPDYLAIAEWLNLEDWLDRFPTGIFSYVCDTFNTWKSINHIVARLKDKIMKRDGKLVIRPDTGDPVDILCGTYSNSELMHTQELKEYFTHPEYFGVVALLHNIFGGTTTSTGYIKLDSHIGAIYGDSINLDRQVAIYQRLANKNFCATNTVLGIGSYTYVYQTRDTIGYALKGAWFETLEDNIKKSFNIYKDPFTGDGSKKSLKGFQFVYKDKNGEILCESEVSEEKAFSDKNMLRTIYKDGKFFNQTTLTEIRKKLKTI